MPSAILSRMSSIFSLNKEFNKLPPPFLVKSSKSPWNHEAADYSA
jgi:hypothetical protein